MRRRLLLIVAAAVLLVLGTGLAVLLTRHPPGGTLETNVTDVTVVTPTTTAPETMPRPPKPKPPQAEPVDRRCWTMFGGGPRRTLARPAIDLGVPAAKPMWARGL